MNMGHGVLDDRKRALLAEVFHTVSPLEAPMVFLIDVPKIVPMIIKCGWG